MRATYVPPVKTPATPEHVSRAYRTALTNLSGTPTDRAVAVLHAHGALETWHFKSMYCNAPGNIKAGAEYEGLFTCFPILNEIIDGDTRWFCPEGELEGGPGTPVKGKVWPVPDGHPQSRFRAFESLSGGIEDKIKFLLQPRWLAALHAALEGNPTLYTQALKNRGYMTAPLGPYQRSVEQLTAKYLPVAKATAAAIAVPAIEPDSDELCRDMAACLRFELPPELAARIKVLQAEHIDDALAAARADRDKEIMGG